MCGPPLSSASVADKPSWGMFEAGGQGRPDGPTTVDRLVAAAAEGFADRGYDRVRVQGIARQAGLTTGGIYANFRSKAGLLLQTISTITGTQLDGSAAGPDGRAVDQLLQSTVRAAS